MTCATCYFSDYLDSELMYCRQHKSYVARVDVCQTWLRATGADDAEEETLPKSRWLK